MELMKLKIKINSPKYWIHNFPWKLPKDHKYSRGQLITVAGQKSMIGAIILASESALRVGTGSVKIVCSKETFSIISKKFSSVLKKEVNSLGAFKKFVLEQKKSVFLIGPGMGSNNSTMLKVSYILKNVKYVIIDADALTCFRSKTKRLYSLLDKNKIITPHIKEFHKIFPSIKKKISNEKKILKAINIAKTNIILKGHNTLIGSYDGKIVCNRHTSSELAVIGSGDVLSGIVSSLIGKKKLNPFLAGCAGVWIHGDIAKNFGTGLIAEDIIKGIPKTLKNLKYGRFVKKRKR